MVSLGTFFSLLTSLNTCIWFVKLKKKENPHFPQTWNPADSYKPCINRWREALCSTWWVCSVMGEGFIRGKLSVSRIGVAIMADSRPLNHLVLKLALLSLPLQPLFSLYSSFLRPLRMAKSPSVSLISENCWPSFWLIKWSCVSPLSDSIHLCY